MSKRSIETQLYFLAGICAAITAVSASANHVLSERVQQTVNELSALQTARAAQQRLAWNLGAIRTEVYQVLLHPSSATAPGEAIAEHGAACALALGTVADESHSDEVAQAAHSLRSGLESYVGIANAAAREGAANAPRLTDLERAHAALSHDGDALGERIAAQVARLTQDNETARSHASWGNAGFTIVSMIIFMMCALKIRETVLGPLRQVVDALERVGAGDLTVRMNAFDATEIAKVGESFDRTMASLRNREAQGLASSMGVPLERLAARDLTVRVADLEEGPHATLKHQLNEAIAAMDEAMAQVSRAAEQVSSAAAEISTGSHALAQTTSHSAGAIEEVTASLQEMNSLAMRSTKSAQQASTLAHDTKAEAERGSEGMVLLAAAIEKIKNSADRTAGVVKTIDDLAFQTNLLALNAAVEAARAGDAGKGFAVVADEVRSLATRSADAARTTASLIEESVKAATDGVVLNRDVLAQLSEITSHVRQISTVMKEIADGASRQGESVSQINRAVESLSHTTQQNAATSEETASTAEELGSQARALAGLVSSFRISREDRDVSVSRSARAA